MSIKSGFEKVSENEFRIPHDSFSAYKLSYNDARNISETSKCVLVGRIPDVWFEEATTGLVHAFLKLSRKSLKKNFKSAIGIANSSIRGEWKQTPARRASIEDNVFDRLFEGDAVEAANRNGDRGDASIGYEVNDGGSSISPRASGVPIVHVQSRDDEVDNIHAFYGGSERVKSNDDYTPSHFRRESFGVSSISAQHFEDSPDLQILHMLRYENPHAGDRSSEETDHNKTDSEDTSGGEEEADVSSTRSHQFSLNSDDLQEPPTNGTSPVMMFDDVDDTYSAMGSAMESEVEPSAQDHLKVHPVVRFESVVSGKDNGSVSSRRYRRRKNIAFVNNEPCELQAGEGHNIKRITVKDERKLMKGVRRIARTTQRTTKKGGSEIKQKVIRGILRKYQNGDIIKVDRMLVLIKVAKNMSQSYSFTENEPCDSRIYERWREYLVVLRMTNSSTSTIELQFYDANKTRRSTALQHPDIRFGLTKDVKVQYYSIVDKTISITVSDNDEDDNSEQEGAHIYILQCHDQFTSYRWLYFLGEVLNYKMNTSFQIRIPYLELSIDIEIPDHVLKEMQPLSSNCDQKVTIKKSPLFGYVVEYSGLVEFLRQSILSKVADLKKSTTKQEEMNAWIESHERLWLCFKYYDRLEWAVNNSHILYLQNLLNQGNFQLELRRRLPSSRKTITYDKKQLTEPTPIEGFLTRLSDAFGDEKTFLKKFFRVSYFYSCDNVLFYTKFYRGLPPSPDNVFLRNGNHPESNDKSLYEIARSMPEVYEQSPFPLDNNGHIEWFNEKDFDKKDQVALSELERRSHQVVKAEGLLDICNIKEIRKVSYESISRPHKRLISLIWFSSTSIIEDETIMDATFEIEMVNGSVLKLHAPSSLARDEWMNKLNSLKDYWISRKRDDLDILLATREQNKEKLNIGDYTDSNIAQEAGRVELLNSVASTELYNIDCLSMTKCILMSGYLYMKPKKHSNFMQYFVVLCPGFLMLFNISKPSRVSGLVKVTSCFEHFLTIPINESYVYSGNTTSPDLLIRHREFDSSNPGHHPLPRLYADGWRSTEEEPERCFSIWLGKKRDIKGKDKNGMKYLEANGNITESARNTLPKNPGFINLYRKLGLTGRNLIFMARSRQERELWVTNILTEIDRFAFNKHVS